MITKTVFLVSVLSLPACSKGSHVEATQFTITKFSCQYSAGFFQADRRVALCDTMEECNKVCEANRLKEGM